MNIHDIYNGGLAFDDVLLVPKYTDIKSRLDPSISTTVGGYNLSVPIISSPMDTVTESGMAIEIGRLGGMGIVHRFLSIRDHIGEIESIVDYKYKNSYDEEIPVVCSVGVGSSGVERLKALWDEFGNSIDHFLIDVANGYSKLTADMISLIKDYTNGEARVIAGNVADGDGFLFLAKHGADGVRVGIGGGSICKTKIMTGFGLPTLTSIASCQIKRSLNSEYKNVSIIADGGIRYPGDLVKSIASGADAIMAGGIFAGSFETPGSIINVDGINKKAYYGMASKELQEKRMGGLKPGTCSEGVSTMVNCKGHVKDILNEFSGGLRSAMTYAGSRTLSELRYSADFIKITGAGLSEAHAYGTRK